MSKMKEYESALETTIDIWEYLVENTARTNKRRLPPSLWELIEDSIGLCALCDLFHPSSNAQESHYGCKNCPLYEAGVGCLDGDEESPFYQWQFSELNHTTIRKNSAQQIVNICKKALKELS